MISPKVSSARTSVRITLTTLLPPPSSTARRKSSSVGARPLGFDADAIARKQFDRLIHTLRKEKPRNTALRFRFQTLIQRYTTLQTYWRRVGRQIEEGTYRRDLLRARRRREAARAEREQERTRRRRDSLELDPNDNVDLDHLMEQASNRMDELLEAPAQEVEAGAPNVEHSAPVALDNPAPEAQPAAAAQPAVAAQTGPQPDPSPSMPQPVAQADPGPAEPQSGPKPAAQADPVSPKAPPAAKPAAPAEPAPVRFGKPQHRPPPRRDRSNPAIAPNRKQAPPIAARSKGPGEARMRQIYDNYVDAKRRNNERTDQIDYETVAKSLKKMVPKLDRKHKGKRIDFKVVVKDGKVGIKPVVKK